MAVTWFTGGEVCVCVCVCPSLQNVDLNVTIGSLKKELKDKNELLLKAK